MTQEDETAFGGLQQNHRNIYSIIKDLDASVAPFLNVLAGAEQKLAQDPDKELVRQAHAELAVIHDQIRRLPIADLQPIAGGGSSATGGAPSPSPITPSSPSPASAVSAQPAAPARQPSSLAPPKGVSSPGSLHPGITAEILSPTPPRAMQGFPLYEPLTFVGRLMPRDHQPIPADRIHWSTTLEGTMTGDMRVGFADGTTTVQIIHHFRVPGTQTVRLEALDMSGNWNRTYVQILLEGMARLGAGELPPTGASSHELGASRYEDMFRPIEDDLESLLLLLSKTLPAVEKYPRVIREWRSRIVGNLTGVLSTCRFAEKSMQEFNLEKTQKFRTSALSHVHAFETDMHQYRLLLREAQALNDFMTEFGRLTGELRANIGRLFPDGEVLRASSGITREPLLLKLRELSRLVQGMNTPVDQCKQEIDSFVDMVSFNPPWSREKFLLNIAPKRKRIEEAYSLLIDSAKAIEDLVRGITADMKAAQKNLENLSTSVKGKRGPPAPPGPGLHPRWHVD